MHRVVVLLILIFLASSFLELQATDFRTVRIVTQRGGSASVSQSRPIASRYFQGKRAVPISSEYMNGEYDGGEEWTWQIPTTMRGSLNLVAQGRYGGKVCKTVPETRGANPPAAELRARLVKFPEGFPSDPLCSDAHFANEKLYVPCPYLLSERFLMGVDQDIGEGVLNNPGSDRYAAEWDPRNNPTPNVYENGMAYHFDGQNVLRINRVDLRYDWESRGLLSGVSASGIDMLEDGTLATAPPGSGLLGGIYSNFHYSVVPHSALYAAWNEAINLWLANHLPTSTDAGARAIAVGELNRCGMREQPCSREKNNAYRALQYLLHIAHPGHPLSELAWVSNPNTERPQLLVEGLVPGPFWSKQVGNAEQCEWGDTSYQAPHQRLAYQNFGIFDWDSLTNSADPCVDIIIWEGDGGATALHRAQHNIGDSDIADDFVGFFTVCRSETMAMKPVTFTNVSGDFSITFSTGNTVSYVH